MGRDVKMARYFLIGGDDTKMVSRPLGAPTSWQRTFRGGVVDEPELFGAGWGETEVLMEVSSRRLAIVQHRHPPARGLLFLISLLRAFLLTVIKRNQAE